MSKSDTQKLLDLSVKFAELQRQMDEVLKNGCLEERPQQMPQQAISPEEIIDQQLLAVLQPKSASTQVGEMLRVFRQSVGGTQGDISKFSGISRKQVGKTEKGQSNPTLSTLIAMSEASGGAVVMGVQPKDLG